MIVCHLVGELLFVLLAAGRIHVSETTKKDLDEFEEFKTELRGPIDVKVWLEQGHHHNGDQAARRPRMMCSICGRRFTTLRLGYVGIRMSSFGSPPMYSY